MWPLFQHTLGAKYIVVSEKKSTPVVNTYYQCNGRENNFEQCVENEFADCDKTSLKAGLVCGGVTKCWVIALFHCLLYRKAF